MKYPWPFAPVPLWLLQSELSSTATLIYARMALAMQEDGTCTTKVQTIANWVRLKRSRIHEALAELRRTSLLTVVSRNRYWVTYRLTLNPPALFRCPKNRVVEVSGKPDTLNGQDVRETGPWRPENRTPGGFYPLNQDLSKKHPPTPHRSAATQHAGGRPFSSDNWTAYWQLFVDSGKPLNPQDQRKARAVWRTLSELDQAKALPDAGTGLANGRWRSPDYTPLPVNHLTDQPWTRQAAPRKEAQSIYGPLIRRKAAASES